MHGVRGEPKVHREVVVGVPVGELVVGGEQLAQTLDRRGCLAVDLHAEQLGGDQHQRVQARVWELAGDYGEGLAEPFRVVATLGDAMRDESEVRLAVGVASCTSDDTTKHPAVPGRPICVRANGHISPIERLEGLLARKSQAKLRGAGPAEPFGGKLCVRRVADGRVGRGHTTDGLVVRVLSGDAPVVAVHGGGCGERLEVLLAEHLEDRGRTAGDIAEQTAHGVPGPS